VESKKFALGRFIHEFVGDRISCIMLEESGCNITVLNVHAPTENRIDDIEDIFCEELELVVDKLPQKYMKMLSDANNKICGDDISKQQFRASVCMKVIMTMKLM
jgi:aminoglycoside N3'-acetyltransferase